jgi:hydrogenase expression/formation protein HypD
MKFVDEYRQEKLVRALAGKLAAITDRPLRFMEVCGTHTMAIFRHGLRRMLPPAIELVSGPGCPVCVTPAGIIDAIIELSSRPEVIIATFGDMLRIPGTSGSLAAAGGASAKIVYSPMDALEIARRHPEKIVVFPAIGFETTTPTIAATILEARREKINNFYILPANKIMPPALKALMADPELQLDGLLCPGHVSIITGSAAYRFLAAEYGLACAVAGFEPTDILQAVIALVGQIQAKKPIVENCYGRAVTESGNRKAAGLSREVFQTVDSEWRGLGNIEKSGLALREEYRQFDITGKFNIRIHSSREPAGCRCGEILKGLSRPADCPLFGKKCRPASPVGPCMVSSEGTCAAWYRFGGIEKL